jgi:hypothetical protein
VSTAVITIADKRSLASSQIRRVGDYGAVADLASEESAGARF